MKPHRLALALLASLLVTGHTPSVWANPPASVAPELRHLRMLPSQGRGYYTNVPHSLAASVQVGPALTDRVTVAYSQNHKCWIEVRPATPITIQTIRAALTQAEILFGAEDAARRQAAEVVREQQLQAQQQREAENFARRNRLVEIAATQPPGNGLAAAIAAQHRPTVINTTTITTVRPPPAASTDCIRDQMGRYATGSGPLPQGVTNVRVTQTPRKK